MALTSLPNEILILIVHHLDDKSAMDFVQTCKKFYTLKSHILFIEKYSFRTILNNPDLHFKFHVNGSIDHLLHIPQRIENLEFYPEVSTFNLEPFINLQILDLHIDTPLDLSQCKNLKTLSIWSSYSLEHTFNFYYWKFPDSILHLNLIYIYFKGVLPSNLITLTIKGGFNDKLPYLKHLRKLSITGNFNQPLDSDTLPNGLRHLILNLNHFDFPLDDLPETLEILSLQSYSKPLDSLPMNLKQLKIKDHFNFPIDNLPLELETLQFYRDFNKPVNHLPNNLLVLSLGYTFNQPLNNLPSTLKYLTLSDTFNQPINVDIPQCLHGLFKFKCKHNISLYHLPKSIEYLQMYSFNIFENLSLYTNLKSLKFHNMNLNLNSISISTLNKLEELYLSYSCSIIAPIFYLPTCLKKLTIYKHFEFNCSFPDTLEHLELHEFNSPILNFPKNLKYLNLGSKFNYPLYSLPDGLETLVLYNYNHEFTKGLLPNSLKTITLGQYNMSLDHLPNRLKSLNVGFKFNQSVDNLPQSLCRLIFGTCFNKPVDSLPVNLKYLRLGPDFNHPLWNLPRDLKVLKIDNDNYKWQYFNLPSKLEILQIPHRLDQEFKYHGCQFVNL